MEKAVNEEETRSNRSNQVYVRKIRVAEILQMIVDDQSILDDLNAFREIIVEKYGVSASTSARYISDVLKMIWLSNEEAALEILTEEFVNMKMIYDLALLNGDMRLCFDISKYRIKLMGFDTRIPDQFKNKMIIQNNKSDDDEDYSTWSVEDAKLRYELEKKYENSNNFSAGDVEEIETSTD